MLRMQLIQSSLGVCYQIFQSKYNLRETFLKQSIMDAELLNISTCNIFVREPNSKHFKNYISEQ